MKSSITAISSIPDIRRRINLVTIIIISCLIIQTVLTVLREITILSSVFLLLSVGVNLLLICNLYRVFKAERATAALGVISATTKALFIVGCILFGLFGLIVLFCVVLILLAGIKEAGAMLILLAPLAVAMAVLFAQIKLYNYISKVAMQLKTNEYDASEAPEKWALISMISSFVLLLFTLILFLCVPTLPKADPERKTESMMIELADKLANRNNDLILNILQYALSALQCASCYAVYMLFKTLRLNTPVKKKELGKKKVANKSN